jgi:arginyl-tRNA synthetase
MPDPQEVLTKAVAGAMVEAFGDAAAGSDPVIRPASAGRGDYQANGAMALGKRLGRPAREVADAVVAALPAHGAVRAVEVAGPGFINLTLDEGWLAEQVRALLDDDRLGVLPTPEAKTIVVDYSSPNVAREMHVGHLRSTVIGDALVRVLQFLGHRVIRQNHVGDWGTQFGMLIEHLASTGWEATPTREIGDLNALYQEAQRRFQSDAEFAERSRQRVVALQAGDPATLALWRDLVAESERHFGVVYDRLGVLLTAQDIRGESFYNDQLPVVAAELEATGVAVVDDGALCVFPPGFTGRDGSPLPLIVRNSVGGFGYAATDLAAIRYRVRELGADRIIYVVDARQSQHFAMVFAAARLAGWLPEDAGAAEHVPFGTILGADGRPFRTRSGETVKLADLLDEAELQALAVVSERGDGVPETRQAAVARAIGVGAVKYADLSSDRIKDYVFELDRMLSFEGKTAPYLQYAYVRIRSIFRRGEIDPLSVIDPGPVSLAEPEERALALALLQFDEAVRTTAELLAPHRLAGYLFELAQSFTAFFEACPVLHAPSEELRRSRLALCEITGRVLALGLGLLGIETVDQM